MTPPDPDGRGPDGPAADGPGPDRSSPDSPSPRALWLCLLALVLLDAGLVLGLGYRPDASGNDAAGYGMVRGFTALIQMALGAAIALPVLVFAVVRATGARVGALVALALLTLPLLMLLA